ncbi:unnamed protein product [Pleuronectes platessa]|uniref:Uncharacterized protein n=1 Tax=Pleuronectes platessa TaxID=8262 RepID=A0A9N7V3S4_PLEPL|nr:unnamed protein product [Pleuronectes platessa]
MKRNRQCLTDQAAILDRITAARSERSVNSLSHSDTSSTFSPGLPEFLPQSRCGSATSQLSWGRRPGRQSITGALVYPAGGRTPVSVSARKPNKLRYSSPDGRHHRRFISALRDLQQLPHIPLLHRSTARSRHRCHTADTSCPAATLH